MLTIRKADPSDLERIMEIYGIAQDFMAASGNPNQWGHRFPPKDLIREDIQKGISYLVCEGDRIHGVTALCEGEDPTYRIIDDGAWKSDTPYVTIHRIAGDQEVRGILSCVLNFCRKTWNHIRIDTHEDNKVMQSAVARNGFDRCGIIYLQNGSPRIAYEWVGEAEEH